MSVVLACRRILHALAAGGALVAGAALAAAGGAGQLRHGLAAASDAKQHYDLFLPEGYPGTRRWPVLLVLDPRGRAQAGLAMALPAARTHGWLVLSAHGSRSDDREQLTFDALQALLRELGARYAYDPGRVYVAGMSGTAKSLWVAEELLQGLVAGYIGAGGGRPPELGPPRAAPPFFGFAGNHDFNYREMRELDAALAKAGTAHRLVVFRGAHGWPRSEGEFGMAIDWLELQAMRQGSAPRREDWLDAQLAQARARVAAAAASPLERWRALDALVRDFDGLRAVDDERRQAELLATSPALREARDAEQRLLAEEARFARALDEWATRLSGGASEAGRLPPPDTRRTLAALRIRSLQQRSQDPADPAQADSATRRLELAYAAGAHYLADEQQRRGNAEGARAALAFAAAVFPERAYPACRLAGLANRQALAGNVAACGSAPVRNAR